MSDRFALVTGGGVRLGRAICDGLAEDGFGVAVHFNNSEREARETVAALTQRGHHAVAVQGDLSEAKVCADVVARVLNEFGALDVVVNSAASFTSTRLGETSPDDWDDIFALNTRAPFLIAQAAAPHLREGGAIVNIADLAGIQAWPSYVAHGASKAALIHLTRSLARSLGPRVRVNAIAPGAVLLPAGYSAKAADRLVRETPLGRLGEPADVVNAVKYLIDAPFVTGSLVVVDGGRSVR
ncbi:MAG TPA: SDR family oxidoreductase [Gemmatimonadaceae bacterium]|nr:SDR family oxidoreductase [Gemmatimonadaceae bacterium]